MNANALRDALAILFRSRPGPLVDVGADAARLPVRALGQKFEAQLVAELKNGRSLIDVSGVRLDVKLPVQARVGDRLQLEVLALEPRLTFGLAGAPGSAQKDSVAMSASFRRLSALLERPAEGASPARTGAAAPVMASPPADTAAFAENLRTALTRSGLFYESHQAQWVAGERTLEDLMQEPQAALRSSSGEPVHPQAVGLVRQQLEALDTRQIVWQGLAWPDQPLEWRIEEEAPRDQAATDDATPSWKTSLRLTLPRLGEVSATLSIQGDAVRLAFAGLSNETQSAVRDAQVALRDAYTSAGLTLLEMRVDRGAT